MNYILVLYQNPVFDAKDVGYNLVHRLAEARKPPVEDYEISVGHNRLQAILRAESYWPEISFDLFTSYMNLWYEYVKAYNRMYAEYIRNTREMTEFWLDLFSKF